MEPRFLGKELLPVMHGSHLLIHQLKSASPPILFVQADLAWFLTEELLPLGGGKAVTAATQRLCAELAPAYAALVRAFAIPDHLVAAVGGCSWR